MGARSPEELEKALAAAQRQVAELQAWADSGEAEAEALRARVAELEARPPPASSGSSAGQAAELQVWLDASEAEVAALKARLAKAEEALARQARTANQATEAQAWLDSEREENEALKAKMAEEEKMLAWEERQLKELQSWLDAAEAENEKLKAELAELDPAQVARDRERLAELETQVRSLTDLNRHFSAQAEAGARREVDRLSVQLQEARASGNPEKLAELQFTLDNAREAISTLEAERRQAVAQVQRYLSHDSEVAGSLKKQAQVQLDALTQEKDARIAVLQSSLGQREAELKTLEGRLAAHLSSGAKDQAELERLRVAECEAREQLGHVRGERDQLEEQHRAVTHHAEEVERQLAEARRWLEAAQKENDELEKKLEQERLAGVARDSSPVPGQPPAGAARPAPQRPGAAPAAEDEPEGTEGFSIARLRRLESLLSSEQARAENLQHFLQVAERSLASTRDALELAQARLKDLAARLKLSDAEVAELLQPLDAGLREVADLRTELAETLHRELPPPPPLDAFEVERVEEADVVSAPLGALDQLAESQAAAARQATEALQGEQRAREQLVGDLQWLKAELDKLSSVRDELRGRLASMVQRELKRKATMASLLERLRATEASTAARAGALRRLQAAIELAQRNAVKVQTVYFQKQIGSLSRQLDAALGKKRPPRPLTGAATAPAPRGPGPRAGAG